MVRILIGSDVCPMGSMEAPFIEGNAPAIFHDLLDEIGSAHLAIVNLECPLVSQKTPIKKAGGWVLGAAAECIRGVSAAKWHLVNLANNHSFDQGEIGLRESMQVIRQAGLSVVGAGANIAEAKQPFSAQIDGQRVVVYSMAEREYSIADENGAGANPLDLINFVHAIQSYKQGGVLIVLLHGGMDGLYPSPEMVRRCRFMIDMGADAVVCSHSHRPQPWEIYKERPIVYGMGNLVFEELQNPLQNPPPGWHEGYLVRLTIAAGKVEFLPIPYFQCRPVLGAKKMDDRSQEQFFSEMQQRNSRLQDAAFLAREWSNYCQGQKEHYLVDLYGYNRWMRKLRRVLLPTMHSNDELLRALHLAQCETHLEVLNTVFREARKSRS